VTCFCVDGVLFEKYKNIPEGELTEKTVYLGEKAKKLLRAILKKLFNTKL
jgi:hypothetical protein